MCVVCNSYFGYCLLFSVCFSSLHSVLVLGKFTSNVFNSLSNISVNSYNNNLLSNSKAQPDEFSFGSIAIHSHLFWKSLNNNSLGLVNSSLNNSTSSFQFNRFKLLLMYRVKALPFRNFWMFRIFQMLSFLLSLQYPSKYNSQALHSILVYWLNSIIFISLSQLFFTLFSRFSNTSSFYFKLFDVITLDVFSSETFPFPITRKEDYFFLFLCVCVSYQSKSYLFVEYPAVSLCHLCH